MKGVVVYLGLELVDKKYRSTQIENRIIIFQIVNCRCDEKIVSY